jgi:hypothetical protein
VVSAGRHCPGFTSWDGPAVRATLLVGWANCRKSELPPAIFQLYLSARQLAGLWHLYRHSDRFAKGVQAGLAFDVHTRRDGVFICGSAAEWHCSFSGYADTYSRPCHSMERVLASFVGLVDRRCRGRRVSNPFLSGIGSARSAALRGITANRRGYKIGFRGQKHS